MNGFPWALCPPCCLGAGVAQWMRPGRQNGSVRSAQCCVSLAVVWGFSPRYTLPCPAVVVAEQDR